jgi:hypothetical protein
MMRKLLSLATRSLQDRLAGQIFQQAIPRHWTILFGGN